MAGEASWRERILDTEVRIKAIESEKTTMFRWQFTFSGCTVTGPTVTTINRARVSAEAYIRAICSVDLPLSDEMT